MNSSLMKWRSLRGYGRAAMLNKINQSFDVNAAPRYAFGL